MSDESDRATAEQLVAEGIMWEEVWAAAQRLALERGEWAGYPVPVQEAALVIEPRHPAHDQFHGVSIRGLVDQPAVRVCTEDDVREDLVVRNEWYSRARGVAVVLYQHGAGGRVTLALLPTEPALQRLTTTLRTFEPAARAWTFEAEVKAMAKLATLLPDHLWRLYWLTGHFLETSARSGVTYVFRRLRPTLALRPDPTGAAMRCLGALCLHPLGYYQGTWGGVMCPTDDVIAHLLFMRGDEPRFWRTANQMSIETPEAGV